MPAVFVSPNLSIRTNYLSGQVIFSSLSSKQQGIIHIFFLIGPVPCLRTLRGNVPTRRYRDRWRPEVPTVSRCWPKMAKAVELSANISFSHWRIADSHTLPRAQTARHAAENAGQPVREKVHVQFINQQGRLSELSIFDHNPHESSQTWQVRSEFDLMMLENAREHGVACTRESAFWKCCSKAIAASGYVQEENGQERVVHAKVVVDASGQGAMIASRLKRRVGSGPAQGRPLDLLGRRLPRRGPR